MTRTRTRKGPEFMKYFGPVLDAVKENDASARPKEVYDWIIANCNVPEEELEKTNKNGRSNFENKIAFARFYLVKAGYLDGDTRGVWALTEKGRAASIDRHLAMEIFDDVQARFRKRADAPIPDPDEDAPDDDAIIRADANEEDAYLNLSEAQEQISLALHSMTSKGFEEFCARILRTLGFENVTIRGGTGDGGIDGFGELLVNRFMRTKVAFQCKKYGDGSSVGPEKIRDFRGAIAGRVDRGVFLTTSRFTKAASEEARRDNATPIELVDLPRLIDIVIEERIGVTERRSIKVDAGFFAQYAERALQQQT
jgi:restriction system protein